MDSGPLLAICLSPIFLVVGIIIGWDQRNRDKKRDTQAMADWIFEKSKQQPDYSQGIKRIK